MSGDLLWKPTDFEGDSFISSAIKRSAGAYIVELSDSGLITVTPVTDFVGTLQIEARVDRASSATDIDSQLITIKVVA